MADLWENDRILISNKPFDNDNLDKLREHLRAAEKYHHDKSLENLNQPYQNAISMLLVTLQRAPVSSDLCSPVDTKDIASELENLFTHFRTGDISYEYFRPLVRLILQKASDADIWK